MAEVVGRNEPTRGRRRAVLWGILGLVAAVIAVILIVAALDDTAGPERGVALEEIAEQPAEFTGETVTVSAEIAQRVAPSAFTIGEAGQQVLVLTRTPIPAAEEDTAVQVTGEIRQLVIADAEANLGVDLDDDLFAPWVGEPVIFARSIDLAGEA